MTHTGDLKDVSEHFAFGENWSSFSAGIDESSVQEAEAGLRRLFGDNGLLGKRILDIGCGSGIHSAAALRLGASEVVATDIDPQSVTTARGVIARYAGNGKFSVFQISVFDLSPDELGTFDAVYSWGVLHHTGAMTEAIERASRMVSRDGIFAFALYQTTLACAIWQREKRLYSRAPAGVQFAIRMFYITALRLAFLASGRNFDRHVKNYRTARGMDFYHDVHDWLGGYPYESISLRRTEHIMGRLGFKQIKYLPVVVSGFGIFGSGCDEYVYRRS